MRAVCSVLCTCGRGPSPSVWCGVPKALLPEGNGRDVYPRVQVNGRAVCVARAPCVSMWLLAERGGVGETWMSPSWRQLSSQGVVSCGVVWCGVVWCSPGYRSPTNPWRNQGQRWDQRGPS